MKMPKNECFFLNYIIAIEGSDDDTKKTHEEPSEE